MKYIEQLAWLECAAPGCETGRAADMRHVDNMTAAGGWLCREHESEVPC